jgi:hydrogenase assembly chaperone HypC/HupF
MCLAIPGKVKKIKGRQALVEYPGEVRPALIGEKGVKVGNYVLVQMGIIIKILSKKEAQVALEAWKKTTKFNS